MLARRSFALVLMASAPLFACGEEHPDPLVNDDVSWQLGCAGAQGCNTFRQHNQQSEKVEDGFTVTCTKESTGFTIIVVDKGDEADNRPSSELKIENLNVANDSCSVFVSERSAITDAQDFQFEGQCANGDCEITGESGGEWDFKGTIKCKNLEADGVAAHSLVKSAATGAPVEIAVDNCD